MCRGSPDPVVQRAVAKCDEAERAYRDAFKALMAKYSNGGESAAKED
jgi:hypothetical protein